MKVKINSWQTAATWSWNIDADYCTICQMSFDACCPDCKLPGDTCTPTYGKCNHAFHVHCILKWQQAQTGTEQCPVCRSEWHYRDEV